MKAFGVSGEFLKVFMPAKPHKHGLKMFLLCDSKGFAIRIIFYQGAKRELESKTSLVVSQLIMLCEETEEAGSLFSNAILTFDGAFSSLELLLSGESPSYVHVCVIELAFKKYFPGWKKKSKRTKENG